MSSVSCTITLLMYLALSTSAYPQASQPYVLHNNKPENACDPGMSYYTCFNGQYGCFKSSPCSHPTNSTTPLRYTNHTSHNNHTFHRTALPPYTNYTSNRTVFPLYPNQPSSRSCSTRNSTATLFQPTMFIINPLRPNVSEPAVDFLRLQSQSGEIVAEQVALFQGIPVEAKSCKLKWAQGNADGRVFVANGNGQAKITPLTGLPAKGTPISSDSIKHLLNSTSFYVDFSNFDQVKGASVHEAKGVFACAELLAFRVQLEQLNGAGNLYMRQDEKNGLYVEYSC